MLERDITFASITCTRCTIVEAAGWKQLDKLRLWVHTPRFRLGTPFGVPTACVGCSKRRHKSRFILEVCGG